MHEMETFLSTDHVSEPPPGLWELLDQHFGHTERHLSEFTSLKKLTLRNIWGDMLSWEQGLVKTLLVNPQLEHLDLSLDSYTKNRIQEGFAILPCIDSLCQTYGELRALSKQNRPAGTQIPQLQLRALQLRSGVKFPSPESLDKLTDLSKMEHVYLYNDRSSGPTGDLYWVHWDILLPNVMPNLRYIHLYHLDPDAWTQIPDMVRARVRATEDTGAPSLVGFLADVDQVTEVLEESESATWSILQMCTRIAPVPMISLPGETDIMGLQADLEDLKKCDWLTHLSFGWWEEPPLGRGRDSAMMLLVREWFSSLVHLEAVRITSVRGYDILSEEDHEDIAAAMAEACPTLAYVQIQQTSWKVRRLRQQESPATVVRLEAWELADEPPEFFQFG